MDPTEARPTEPIPPEDDELIIDPRMYLRILQFDGRKAPRKMWSVTYALRRNSKGPIHSIRDFDFETDAFAFGDLVRNAGGIAEEPKETTL